MKLRMYLSLALLITFSAVAVYACDIFLTTDKEKYKIGDTVVLKMEVKWTHKTCVKEAVEPVLKLSGLELVAKTKFKEKSSGLWEVKFKMKVTEKNASINAYEDCPKGGGIANIKLQIED